eukprot:gene6289-12733_t
MSYHCVVAVIVILGSISLTYSSKQNQSNSNYINLRPETVLDILTTYNSAVQRLTQKASTEECKSKILAAYDEYWHALAHESAFPFEDVMFHSECNSSTTTATPLMPLRTKVYPPRPPISPPPVPPRTQLNPNNVSLLYVILVHDQPELLHRLIAALDEPQHTFVIHVDLKANDLFYLAKNLSTAAVNNNVFVLTDEYRQSASWGAFSIVNATLNAMRFGWELQRPFHFVINLSGTSYPIKSNAFMRTALAESSDKIYMEIRPDPTLPPP